jgi:hypothetical protein
MAVFNRPQLAGFECPVTASKIFKEVIKNGKEESGGEDSASGGYPRDTEPDEPISVSANGRAARGDSGIVC